MYIAVIIVISAYSLLSKHNDRTLLMWFTQNVRKLRISVKWAVTLSQQEVANGKRRMCG